MWRSMFLLRLEKKISKKAHPSGPLLRLIFLYPLHCIFCIVAVIGVLPTKFRYSLAGLAYLCRRLGCLHQGIDTVNTHLFVWVIEAYSRPCPTNLLN